MLALLEKHKNHIRLSMDSLKLCEKFLLSIRLDSIRLDWKYKGKQKIKTICVITNKQTKTRKKVRKVFGKMKKNKSKNRTIYLGGGGKIGLHYQLPIHYF